MSCAMAKRTEGTFPMAFSHPIHKKRGSSDREAEDLDDPEYSTAHWKRSRNDPSKETERSALFIKRQGFLLGDTALDIATLRTISQSMQQQHVAETAVKRPGYPMLTLPQELLDMIFSHAYPPDPKTSPIWKFQWKMTEAALQRMYPASYALKPFARLKVEDWLVSKQYFVLAASAWTRAQTFAARSRLGCLDACMQPKGVLGAFLQTAEVDLAGFSPEQIHWVLDRVELWPGLREITLALSESAFADILPHRMDCAWHDDEVERVFVSLGLHNLEHLRKTSWRIMGVHSDDFSDEEIPNNPLDLSANWRRVFQKIENKWKPPTTNPLASPSQRLYAGSKVHWTPTQADLARGALAMQISKLTLYEPRSTSIEMSTKTGLPTIAEVCAALPIEGIDEERFRAMFRRRLRGKAARNDFESLLYLVAARGARTSLFFPSGVGEHDID